jgi:hypothetical protein
VDLVIEVEEALAEIAGHPLVSPLWRLDRPYRTFFPLLTFEVSTSRKVRKVKTIPYRSGV